MENGQSSEKSLGSFKEKPVSIWICSTNKRRQNAKQQTPFLSRAIFEHMNGLILIQAGNMISIKTEEEDLMMVCYRTSGNHEGWYCPW